MKYVITFLALIAFISCQPKVPAHHVIPSEEAFIEIKKTILNCINEDDRASPELKEYVKGYLASDMKEPLLLTKYRQNETDRLLIRQCRRKSFIYSKTRMKNLPIARKEDVKPKMDN